MSSPAITIDQRFRKIAMQMLLAIAVCAVPVPPCAAQSLPQTTRAWDGPSSGPPKQSGKKITFIGQDLRNGGISAAFRSFSIAAATLGWQIQLTDGAGEIKTIRTQFEEALRAHPDAIVIGGFQLDNELAELGAQAKREKIILIGWHAAAEPGPTPDMFVNIATSSSEVGKTVSDYVIQSSNGNVGVVIINDDRFAVANAKTRYMAQAIQACRRCKLLSIENIPISNASSQIPAVVSRLNHTFGLAWTHTLAINDVYFDEMNFPLTSIGRTDVQNISAGDGSNKALSRIRFGKSQQVATIAEPLGVQGWQLADELNRAFAGQSPSGYISKPILVTTALLKKLGSTEIDSDIPYKETYSAIWNGKGAGK